MLQVLQMQTKSIVIDTAIAYSVSKSPWNLQSSVISILDDAPVVTNSPRLIYAQLLPWKIRPAIYWILGRRFQSYEKSGWMVFSLW